MRDESKTKTQLVEELIALRRRVSELAEAKVERNQMTETLAERERYFRSLLHNLHQDILVIDRDYRVVDLNDTFLITTGLKRENVIGRHCFEVSHGHSVPCDARGEQCELRVVFETGESRNCHHTHLRADGSKVHIDILLSPLKDKEGNVTHVIEAVRDISNLMQAQDALRESEEKYRGLFENAIEGAGIFDTAGRVLAMNRAMIEITGYTLEEFSKVNLGDTYVNPEDRKRFFEIIKRDGMVEGFEVQLRNKEGEPYWASLSSRPIKYGDKHAFLTTALDITKRKQAEERIRKEKETLALVNALNHAVNRGDSLQEIIELFDRGARDVFSVEGATVYLLSQNEEQLVMQNLSLPLNLTRRIEKMIGMDIPKVRIRLSAASVHAGILDAGKPWMTDDLATIQQMIAECTESKALRKLAPAISRILNLRSVMSVPLVIGGEAIGLVDMSRQEPFLESDLERFAVVAEQFTAIFKRKQVEEERRLLLAQLRAQARRVQQIIETVPEGVILLDGNDRVVAANPVAKEDLVVLAGAKVGDTLTRLGDRPLAELLTSPPTKGLWHEVKMDGRTFGIIARPMENGPEPENWVLVFRDVTQEREIERRVQHQERLAAVGQLAAGIAHDFNNIMSVIVLYARMGLSTPDIPAILRNRLETVAQQAFKATDLIQQILDFGRQAVLDRRAIDLTPFLKEVVTLLERTVPESIVIGLTYEGDEYTVNADPTRIQQAVMNLVINARDAMLSKGGGKLDISLFRTAETDEIRCVTCGRVDRGEYVQITVADTGEGIPPDVLPHIFEPFFTTKEVGKGSGLGLAQVYGILKQHEGHIDVTTEMGEGTTFTLSLPALLHRQPEAPAQEAPLFVRGQGETILVVEDNATLRRALADILELLNYRALQAADGREALDILEERAGEIALVLSDLVMPEMGGQALFHAMRQRGQTLPVVMLSGHPMEDELENLRSQGLAGWLLKPPSEEQLAQSLARALGKEPE